MTLYTRIVALKYAMIAIGVIFTFAIFPLSLVWPHGWTWGAGHSPYLPMSLSFYVLLGIFLIAPEPDAQDGRTNEVHDQHNKIEGGEMCLHFTALDLCCRPAEALRSE